MSTPNINITAQNIQGKCDLKCAYNFDYLPSDSIATNSGTSIQLSYEKTSSAPVLFNNLKYNVNNIFIYSPSVHLYNGSKTNAEFIIEHVPALNGDMMYVCIPITSSTQTTTAGNVLTDIITSVATNAPSINETTTLNSTFNLTEFVPNKSFVNYTGTSGLIGQVISFSLVDSIPLTSDTLSTLSKIIQPPTLDVSGEKLFLNSDGPNTTTNSDGIYISCNPTGNSEEETEVSYKNNTVNDFASILKSPITQSIIVIALLIFIFFVINFVYNFISE
jgi:carbonic anhydrase